MNELPFERAIEEIMAKVDAGKMSHPQAAKEIEKLWNAAKSPKLVTRTFEIEPV